MEGTQETTQNPSFNSISTSLECGICQKSFRRAAWHCPTCGFYKCDECGPHNKLRCLEGHPLVIRYDVSSYYQQIYNSSMVNCELCCESKAEASWHCRACKYDICIQCARKEGYVLLSQDGGSPICDRPDLQCTQGHILRWRTVQSHCNVCKDRSPKEMFNCSCCNVSVCAECAANLLIFLDRPSVIECHGELQWQADCPSFTCALCTNCLLYTSPSPRDS